MRSLPKIGTVGDFDAWNTHLAWIKYASIYGTERDTLHQCIPFLIYRNGATIMA